MRSVTQHDGFEICSLEEEISVIGTDVVSMFPKMGHKETGERCKKMVEESDLNFEEIELGYKSLAEFYLTLSYHTDDLPVDQLLNLPALSEIPKLPKVNCHLKTRVRFELSILNR